MSIEEKLELLKEVMDCEEDLTMDMILEDIDEWDSLSILTLTVEMKKKYDLILTSEKIKSFRNVKDICDFMP